MNQLMYEKPDAETTTRMRRVRRKGTDIEIVMAAMLKNARVRYRSQPKIKGNPDFRILGSQIVIFCDSSFWHGRYLHTSKAERFNKNQEFWQAKLENNRRKDRRITRELKSRGWIVLRFWDEDIIKHPASVLARLLRTLQMETEEPDKKKH